ncbi:MAG: TonB family protein [Verrucomicrobiae bacterium]|nr:TonB family protein [Verrucomicrobiae bacterium]
MNRLQKKCFIVSALVHLLLLAVLVFGPAFVPARQPRFEVFEVIEFTPLRTTDMPVAGGGSPTGAQPQMVPEPPVAPAPQVKPAPELKPTPAVAPEPPPRPEVRLPVTPSAQPMPVERPAPRPQPQPAQPEPTRAVEPRPAETRPTRRLPQVSTQLVTRAQVAGTNTRPRATRRTQQVDPDQFAAVANSLRQRLGTSSTTSIELLGPGGGGVPYANFKQAVFSAYYNAWMPPATIANENLVTKAAVTIARDGTVISARITDPSGDAAMDASVQRALERVKFVAPLPDGTPEQQRTLIIIFDLRAKRGIG